MQTADFASPKVSKIGDPVRFMTEGGAAIVTLLGVGEYKPGSASQACDLGKCLTAQVSIESIGRETHWTPRNFTIVTNDGDVYEPTGPYQEPSLPDKTTLTTGETVGGWITYDVPKSLMHGTLHIEQGADITF